MWALWYVRTIHKRSNKSSSKFLKNFSLENIDLQWLKFHIYRELFIQYFYQKLLNHFFRDYYKFLKIFHTIQKFKF